MVIITNKNETISLVLARNFTEKIENTYQLRIFNEYGKEEYIFDVLDVSENNSFYRFNGLNFSELEDREYVYELINDTCGLVLECGLIRFLPSTENKIFNNDEEIVIYNG